MSVVIAGSARSGTTWFGQILNHDDYYQEYLFEPLNPQRTDRQYFEVFGKRKYLNPGRKSKNYTTVLRKMAGGPETRLIKTVRSNLMLPYIYEHVKDCKIIYIYRHPCAVAYSWANRNWMPPLLDVLNQDELIFDFPMIAEKINNRYSDEEIYGWDKFKKQAVLWCIENYVPIKYFMDNKDCKKRFCIVSYESFIQNSEQWVDFIFNKFLKRGYVKNRMAEAIKRPSGSCRHGSAILTGADLIHDWRFHVTDRQQEMVYRYCRMFGLDGLFEWRLKV